MKKKTILVVDDTQANIDAAKAYFANNTDFDFVYAMNRKTAEEILPTVDGVITDRSIPFDENDTERQSEGSLLFLLAKAFGKEVVMVTGHGGRLGIGGHVLKDESQSETIYDEVKTSIGKPFSKNFDSNNPTKLELMLFKNVGDKFDWQEGVNKTSEIAWELGSKDFLKKMMLDENTKPVEIPKIKMQ